MPQENTSIPGGSTCELLFSGVLRQQKRGGAAIPRCRANSVFTINYLLLLALPLQKLLPVCIYMSMKVELVQAGLPDAQTIVDMQKKSFQKLLKGISKNSLFAIFSRLRRVETRWIIASFNIAFSKLPLKTEVFRGSLKTYRDYETNPGAEDIQKIIARMNQVETHYYFIQRNKINAGAIRVVRQDGGALCRISPLFILPEEQNNGYAQAALRLVESMYRPQKWTLDTILEERRNCHVYEKAGYRQTGELKTLKEGMHLVRYEKTIA